MKSSLLLSISLVSSCSNAPIKSWVSIDDSSIKHEDKILVTLHAKKPSKKSIEVTPVFYAGDKTIMSFTGVYFVPDEESNVYGITRDNYVSSHGSMDSIAPGETKKYNFYWQPKDYDTGEGALHMNVPSNFSTPKPIRITIETKSKMHNKAQ